MLELKVRYREEDHVLQFEHSLLSLSKWESIHKKPFLSRSGHSSEEMIDYFEAMLCSPGVDPDMVYLLSPEQLEQLSEYVSDTRTASSVPGSSKKGGSTEVVTSELIYYWLVGLQIPFHPTETWHLNRLMMLVQITNYKQQPAEKQKPAEFMSDWRAANEANKKRFGVDG